MAKIIDFRSDTVTYPSPAMLDAMVSAPLGDDSRDGDPTVRRLEERCAALLAKEAGLFVPSGTMGNLVAVMTWTEPGDGVVLERWCHLNTYEADSFRLTGARAYPVEGRDGFMPPERIREAFQQCRSEGNKTRLLCLENTGNLAGGAAVPPDQMRAMEAAAREFGACVHLDGARIFNAAFALNVPAQSLAAVADSVMFCFSKGLSAPVGSILVGEASFIQEACKVRRMLGGNMRQSGVLAAAALVALDEMEPRLREDHAKACLLAEGLKAIPGLQVHYPPTGTNMVFVNSQLTEWPNKAIVEHLARHGIRASVAATGWIRLVAHKDVTREDAETVVECLKKGLGGSNRNLDDINLRMP